jgi:hypothetical protein
MRVGSDANHGYVMLDQVRIVFSGV